MNIVKNFRVNLIFRILILMSSIAGLLYFILISELYLRSVYLGIFVIILMVEMIWYIERTNRDFNAFLLGLLQADFTATFNEKSKGKSFTHLYATFNKINRKFRKISADKEIQHLYLETMVEHVKTGIISYNGDGDVNLINDAFKELLQKPHLTNIISLSTVDTGLVESLKSIKPNDRKLIKLTVGGNLLQLSLHCTSFKIQDEEFKLVSFQDIKNELDAKELDVWQKLIRVLTHEIMNSVTPITSLTSTLYSMVRNDVSTDKTIKEATLNNLVNGLDAILNRSNGLQRFTEAYRDLSRIPVPNFKKKNLSAVIRNVVTLQQSQFPNISIQFETERESISISADSELLEQVLINLIKNAAEALNKVDNPIIDLRLHQKEQQTLILISDNGHGMTEDILDKIFIPFFTTKKHGSGIGLPLCKQIIQLHGGTMSVVSKPDTGATFKLTL